MTIVVFVSLGLGELDLAEFDALGRLLVLGSLRICFFRLAAILRTIKGHCWPSKRVLSRRGMRNKVVFLKELDLLRLPILGRIIL